MILTVEIAYKSGVLSNNVLGIAQGVDNEIHSDACIYICSENT